MADRLGQIGLALFLGGRPIALACFSGALRQIAVLAAFTAEKDERVLRPLDVILVALLRSSLADVGDGGAPATVRARRRGGGVRREGARRVGVQREGCHGGYGGGRGVSPAGWGRRSERERSEIRLKWRVGRRRGRSVDVHGKHKCARRR